MARHQGRELPEGTFLVAEIRSTIVAAAPLDNDGHAFGSPDPCSEQLQELLRSQTSLDRRRPRSLRDRATRAVSGRSGRMAARRFSGYV